MKFHLSVIAAVTAAVLMPTVATSPINAQPSSTEITVYAASSLRPAFDKIAKSFMRKHKNVHITISYGSSGTLATAIVNGAAPDIFASAAVEKMDVIKNAQRAKGTRIFASNAVVLAFPRANPKSIDAVSDLNQKAQSLRWARCVDSAPCGATAKRALVAAGIADTPITMVTDDAAQVALLKSGEVDAAFIYQSDVITHSSQLDSVRFSGLASAVSRTKYPIAVLTSSKHKKIAKQFTAYILNRKKGQLFLFKSGFGKPRG